MLGSELPEIILRSLWVAALAVGLGLVPATMLAFRLSREQNLILAILEYLLYVPLVFPPVVIGWLLLQIEILQFNVLGAVVAACVVSFPLLTQTLRAAFDQIDPRLEEAIKMDGGGKWQVFRFLYVPLVLPGLAAGAVLAFARALGEFGATIVVAGNIPGVTETIPLAIYAALQRPDGDEMLFPLLVTCLALSATSVLAHSLLRMFSRKRL
ncbi:MAG: ABC transporter permease subunit [Rhodothermia bacterium]|nr:ABC transporter permease subunit [Rhodothermia bacterium]